MKQKGHGSEQDVSRETRRNTVERFRCAAYGTVQGVGFRYFVLQHARRLHLSGYTFNRSDGAVEIEATGSAAALEELLRTVRNGPPQARVTRVEILPATGATLPDPFEIIRAHP